MFTELFKMLSFRFLLVPPSLEVDCYRPEMVERLFKVVLSFLSIFSSICILGKYLIVLHSFVMFCRFFGFEDVLSLSHTRRSSFSRFLLETFPSKRKPLFLSTVHYILYNGRLLCSSSRFGTSDIFLIFKLKDIIWL